MQNVHCTLHTTFSKTVDSVSFQTPNNLLISEDDIWNVKPEMQEYKSALIHTRVPTLLQEESWRKTLRKPTAQKRFLSHVAAKGQLV